MSTENITTLMDSGYPVGVKFTQTGPASQTDKLFCELIQQARNGENISFSQQGCPVGAYVLGRDTTPPDEYYFNSGRYSNKEAAAQAAEALPRLEAQYSLIQLFPLTEDTTDFDVMLLFLSPEKATRLVQAFSYHDGRPLTFTTGGTASICGDCTAAPATNGRICVSLGCKGSRKHSKYGEDELIAAIPFNLVKDIHEGLLAIPGIFD
ncbi:MAG: DUF169 domain-containing protein [Methanosarcinales archaeon]|nr:DUF169 domain-containing protein [Methanosarcinales archaeon]